MRLNEYKSQMLKGEWNSDVPKPLLFDSQGKFANGFHRMKAIIKAGSESAFFQGVKILVKVNSSEEEILLLDQGREQSAADSAAMRGVEYANESASSFRAIYVLEINCNTGFSDKTHQKMAKHISDEAKKFVFQELRGEGSKHFRKSSVRAAFLLAYDVNPQKVRELALQIKNSARNGGAMGTAAAIIKASLRTDLRNAQTRLLRMVLRGIETHLKGDVAQQLSNAGDGHPWFSSQREQLGLKGILSA